MNLNKYLDPNSFAFLFILFLALMNGVSWGFADTYDHMTNVDVQTYVGLSNFDLDQHPVRRYRVIVPFLAAGVKAILGPLFSALSPNEFPGDFPTIMSFLCVNNILMALYCFLVFRLCQAILGNKGTFFGILLGIAAIITCRWTAYLSGSALVDSLFLVVLGLLLLGIQKRECWMIILAIYLGPWAKESFIFFVPLLFFSERSNWIKYIVHLIISGVCVFAFRYWFDQHIGAGFGESISRDVSHFAGIPNALRRLFSFHGIYELASIGGLWNIFILLGLFQAVIRSKMKTHINLMWVVLVVSVFIQAILSSELARMFYLMTPLLALVIAIVFNESFAKSTHTIESD